MRVNQTVHVSSSFLLFFLYGRINDHDHRSFVKTNQSFEKGENSFLTSGGGLQLASHYQDQNFSINYELSSALRFILL